MTIKENILDCLITDDEAFTEIVEYFKSVIEVDIPACEIKTILSEMIEEGYVFINNEWKNQYEEYPYSLTEKGKNAWKEIEE